VATPLHGGTFVLDALTGAPCKADKAHLTVALEFKASPETTEERIRCLLLVTGAKGARCLADFGDERVARVDWGQKAGGVVRAHVLERSGNCLPFFKRALLTAPISGSYALVVLTDRHEALVYSIPTLEHLHTLPLPTTSM
jgi:hypothetical protein